MTHDSCNDSWRTMEQEQDADSFLEGRGAKQIPVTAYGVSQEHMASRQKLVVCGIFCWLECAAVVHHPPKVPSADDMRVNSGGRATMPSSSVDTLCKHSMIHEEGLFQDRMESSHLVLPLASLVIILVHASGKENVAGVWNLEFERQSNKLCCGDVLSFPVP